MRLSKRASWVLLACASLLSGCVLVRQAWLQRFGLPRAEIEPSAQRVIANSADRQVTALYRVWNKGGGTLVLGDPAVSCGCRVASVEPRVVSAGKSALVRVEATAHPSIERSIEILFPTNKRADGSEPLVLHLTVIGNTPPPYVIHDSGAVQFGQIESAGAAQQISIMTCEKLGSQPWIHGVRCSSASVAVEGGLQSERNTKDVAFRVFSIITGRAW